MVFISYDKVADAIYIKFNEKKISKSIELDSGVIIDFASDGSIVGLEILNFSQRQIDLNKIVKMSADEIIPFLVVFKPEVKEDVRA